MEKIQTEIPSLPNTTPSMRNLIPKITKPAAGNRLKCIESVLKHGRAGLLLALCCLQRTKPGANAAENALIEKANAEIVGFDNKMDALEKEIRQKQRGQSKVQPKVNGKLS